MIAIDDRAALAEIAAHGGELTGLLGDGWGQIRSLIAAEVQHEIDADPDAGIGIRRHSHRLFDPGWLVDPDARFELAGVVYRVDLIDPGSGTCGDIRLIYRLAYRYAAPAPIASRLPMTIAVVIPAQPARESTYPAATSAGAIPAACRTLAASWIPPTGATGAELGRWLHAAGPLRDALVPARVGSALVNVQLARWPSAVQPDLGGHADYLFASFVHAAAGRWSSAPLPINPDLTRFAAEPAYRTALLAWLRDPATIAAVDRGAALLPSALGATQAHGVTPGGFARRANRPFSRVITAGDLTGLDLAATRVVKSPAGYLRRLDELTCNGCHQLRALGGFHWLGVDDPDLAPGEGLAAHQSPHVRGELARRTALAQALAAGAPVDLTRPFAEHPPSPGRLGDHCGLGAPGADPAFAGWTCDAGLHCDRGDTPTGDDTVGVCMGPAPAAVGDACDIAPIVAGRNAGRDRVAPHDLRRCVAGATCDPRRLGLPGGLCVARCTAAGAPAGPGQTCGRVGTGTFNLCLLDHPFTTCLRDHSHPVSLAACDPDHPCRDDYLCAVSPGGPACVPPYFLFQLRVDGHPPSRPPPK